MRPLTVDDSTDSEVPETLEVLFQSVLEDHCDDEDRTKVDHVFVVLLCTLMMECGFSLKESWDSAEEDGYLASFDVRRLRSVQRMPRDWWSREKSSYELRFVLPVLECRCLLVALRLPFALCVSAVVPGETRLDRVVWYPDVRRYVRSGGGPYADLKRLSREFKNCVAVPIRGRLLRDRGLPDVHLASLPVEILLTVANLLDYRSLAILSQTCRRLYDVLQDDSLWKPLCLERFRAEVASSTHEQLKKNWFAVFRALKERREGRPLYSFTGFEENRYRALTEI
ncbi:uncharacterized protein LOC134527653 [Bacillus rossius redtenbacheri]|uniref:uncharacterized protein LOC134527653 n=1 Tax=Bacillus rossius redtenbacheri TaxID=93214 RepID=UPI002FDC8D56